MLRKRKTLRLNRARFFIFNTKSQFIKATLLAKPGLWFWPAASSIGELHCLHKISSFYTLCGQKFRFGLGPAVLSHKKGVTWGHSFCAQATNYGSGLGEKIWLRTPSYVHHSLMQPHTLPALAFLVWRPLSKPLCFSSIWFLWKYMFTCNTRQQFPLPWPSFYPMQKTGRNFSGECSTLLTMTPHFKRNLPAALNL
jgi:hypothetical protein